MIDDEAGVGDERRDVAREMTSAGESKLQRLEAALPADRVRVRSEAVFEKVEATPGTNHPSQFSERPADVGDAAERERRQGCVRAGVGERERLSVEADVLDGHPRGGDAVGGQTSGHGNRLDGEHDIDGRWIVLDVQSRSEADLDHAAAKSIGGGGTPAGDVRRAAHPVRQARQDLITVEAHCRTVAGAGEAGSTPCQAARRHPVAAGRGAGASVMRPTLRRMSATPPGGRHTLVNIDDPAVESFQGRFFRVRRALGTTAFGINEIRLPAGSSGKEHDESETGHEEVYVILERSGTFALNGTEAAVRPGDYLRVEADVVRMATSGPNGLRFVALGGKPLSEYDSRTVL